MKFKSDIIPEIKLSVRFGGALHSIFIITFTCTFLPSQRVECNPVKAVPQVSGAL